MRSVCAGGTTARLNVLASENAVARFLIVGGCAYECFAMLTHGCPTLSMWCWRLGIGGKMLSGLILVVLGIHLYATPEQIRDLRRVPALRITDGA